MDAAIELSRLGHRRSAVSRAYYAAYSLGAAVMILDESFEPRLYEERQGLGPGHEELPRLLSSCFKLGYLKGERTDKVVRGLADELETLRKARLDADYSPNRLPTPALVERIVRSASAFCKAMKEVVSERSSG